MKRNLKKTGIIVLNALVLILLAGAFTGCPHKKEGQKKSIVVSPSYFGPDWSAKNLSQDKKRIEIGMKKGGLSALYFPDTVAADPGILDYFPIKPTDVIADIGAGTGGFEFMLLQKKVSFQKVIAVDIDAASLDLLGFILQKLPENSREKIDVVRSMWDDVRLPAGTVDLALIVNSPSLYNKVYPEGQAPEVTSDPCLASLHQALKPNGRVYVFHVLTQDPSSRVDFNRVRLTFESSGFHLKKIGDFDFDRGAGYLWVFVK